MSNSEAKKVLEDMFIDSTIHPLKIAMAVSKGIEALDIVISFEGAESSIEIRGEE
jgi:hypothetical protein